MKQTGKMLGAGLLAGLFVLLAEPAQAETWCIRDAGSPPPGACVFPSSHDCGMAARMMWWTAPTLRHRSAIG